MFGALPCTDGKIVDSLKVTNSVDAVSLAYSLTTLLECISDHYHVCCFKSTIICSKIPHYTVIICVCIDPVADRQRHNSIYPVMTIVMNLLHRSNVHGVFDFTISTFYKVKCSESIHHIKLKY